MVFWSKSPENKKEQIAANKERDIKVRAHQLHMQNSAAQAEAGKGDQGYSENAEPEAGLNEDFVSKVGAERKVVKQQMHEKSRQLSSMRARVRLGRRKAKSRGKSLGF